MDEHRSHWGLVNTGSGNGVFDAVLTYGVSGPQWVIIRYHGDTWITHTIHILKAQFIGVYKRNYVENISMEKLKCNSISSDLPVTGYGLISFFSCQYSWWRHQMETFPRYWPFCAGNSPVPVKSSHKGQWRGALIFSLNCAWLSTWVNNR